MDILYSANFQNIRKFSDFWTCSTSLNDLFINICFGFFNQILQWPYKNYLVCITIIMIFNLHRTEWKYASTRIYIVALASTTKRVLTGFSMKIKIFKNTEHMENIIELEIRFKTYKSCTCLWNFICAQATSRCVRVSIKY